MEIKNISQKIFRSAPNRVENSVNHTNPFGVNFQGNMINADVFVKPIERTDLVQKAAKKGRMWASAIVGSMNSVNESICRRLDSVINFGKRITSNVSELWDRANNIEVPSMKKIISWVGENISENNRYSAKNLEKCEIEELDTMLQDSAMIRLLEV